MDRRFTTGKVYYGRKFARILELPAIPKQSVIDRLACSYERHLSVRIAVCVIALAPMAAAGAYIAVELGDWLVRP